MSRMLNGRARPFNTIGMVTVLGLTAFLAAALPATRCEAYQAGWPALAAIVHVQTSNTAPGAVATRTAHALPASRTAQRRPDRHTAKIILAIVLAAVAAFDLWILRHLGKVYLSPRLARRRLCLSSGARNRTGPPYIE